MRFLLLCVLAGASLVPFTPAHALDAFADALVHGKPDLFLRYRFELVDDASPRLKKAYASTLRTALGYNTGDFYNFSAYVQLEDVRVVGQQLYNNGGENGIRDRAVVVDPQGSEINQAYIRYGGVPRTVLAYGRQEITHREAPFHRFIGNILFRQNWQTFDAFRATTLALPQTTIDYAYVWNVNRIFGEDNKLPDLSDFPMHSHLLNVQYGGLPIVGKLEAYAYLLDFATVTAARFSTATYGLRLQDNRAIGAKTKLLYAAEYAKQRDYAENANDISVNYFAGEIGASQAVGGAIESVSAKLSYEFLGGKGGVKAFQTPLGTNHAFQGTADRFLVTPGDGIKDWFVTFGLKIAGATANIVYHDFTSDHDSYAYGSEWDFLLQKPFAKNFLCGIEYAVYKAKRNSSNVARNSASGQAFDLSKLWLYLQYRY
jgi:hypothetical protein